MEEREEVGELSGAVMQGCSRHVNLNPAVQIFASRQCWPTGIPAVCKGLFRSISHWQFPIGFGTLIDELDWDAVNADSH
jgi:hypothetical protein